MIEAYSIPIIEPTDPGTLAAEEIAATEAMMANMSERIAALVVSKLLKATE